MEQVPDPEVIGSKKANFMKFIHDYTDSKINVDVRR